MVVFFLGTVYGWDRGYDVAIKQVASALKEQINEGRTFRLKNIDIKFYPRKEGSTNYALAGAGADVPVKK